MIQECPTCKRSFLTEADPYIVLPKSSGYELHCFCTVYKLQDQIKALDSEDAKARLTGFLMDYKNHLTPAGTVKYNSGDLAEFVLQCIKRIQKDFKPKLVPIKEVEDALSKPEE